MERPDLLDRLGVIVESRAVRTALVVLIILSVLPEPALEERLRWLYLTAFGLELVVRVPLVLRRVRRGTAEPGEGAFLVVDAIAFLSFLPLEEWFHRRFEGLIFLRLSRLLVLLRFSRSLVRDLFRILTRREQLQQFALVSLAVTGLAFVSAVVLSQLEIGHDYDTLPTGSEDFRDRLWWSFRQLESSDNLVAHLHVHPLVGVLSLTLTVIGVFIISFVIGIGTNVVEQLVVSERRRPVSYSGHTLVVGPVTESETLVREFVRIYRKNRRLRTDQLRQLWRWIRGRSATPRTWRLPRMALLGPTSTPPGVLYEPGMRWVVYRQGDGASLEALERIGARRAKRAILLGERRAGDDADAITVATLSALRELNPYAHVYVELLSPRNRTVLSALGDAGRTHPLDVPWLLGLFLLQHLVVPGVEEVYDELLTAEGSELYSHLFLDPEERAALRHKLGETVPVRVLAEFAAQRGVTLVGLFLGEEGATRHVHDLIEHGGLVSWLAPEGETPPGPAALGGAPGVVPVARLQGLIALAANYRPMRDMAKSLAHPEAAVPEVPSGAAAPPAEEAAVLDGLGPRGEAPAQVLVIGYGDALPSLSQRLAVMRPGVRLRIAHDGDVRSWERLRRPLEAEGIRIDDGVDASTRTRVGVLPREGRLEVHFAVRGDAMDRALDLLREGDTEAVVFLAEPDAADPDARTALRLLRLVDDLLAHPDRAVPAILVELMEMPKGERVRRQAEGAFLRAGRRPPRITLVGTDLVRNYFMVHSAFVPGIHSVYSDLLSARGADLHRLPLDVEAAETGAMRRALARRGLVLMAVESHDGRVTVHPSEGRVFHPRAVFVLGYDPATAVV
jgi:hypothetical protein